MDTLTRRRFLLASGGVAAAAMADAAVAVTWDQLHRAARERPVAVGDRVLVVVTLYGGNDGINTVVPWSDDTYHDARPDLAFSEADVLRLDGRLGLNPAMTGIKSLWDSQQVAIVNGVGYPQPDRSHFRSMDIWQTGSPTAPAPTGWIGRWLDATGDDPLRAVAMGPVLPVLAIGARCTAATLAPGPFVPLPPRAGQFVDALSATSSRDTPAGHQFATGCTAARSADATFTRTLGSAAAPQRSTGPLAAQLESVATAVNAGVPTKVWCVSLGGFDTHSDEKGTQQAAWAAVDGAVAAFFGAVAGAPRQVTMMIHSEFGRRVQANASQGTDHGTAGPVLVIGPEVAGGFHGEYPSLTDLDDGDLRASVDFRTVYGELIGSVLGSDPHAVLDQVPTPLGLVRT